MDFMIPVLAVVTLLIAGVFVFIIISGRSKGSKGTGNRDKIFKEAEKRLAQDPKNAQALNTIGEIYFREENWDQAFKIYSTLMEMESVELNEFDIVYRYAFSAIKLGLSEEAYRGFSAAKNLRTDNFEVNFNLGTLEFQRKNYEKAIALLNQAKMSEPDDAPTLRTLGHAYFRIKKNKEAMTFIRKAIDLAPDDKESLYTLGECYYEANQTEQAQRIFSHLRGDPVMGASACLISGTIHSEARHYDKAIANFELGLRHENIKPDIKLELRYRLALAYIRQNEIGKAISLLREINVENPNYKDVVPLIGKYQELNANKNLQIYLMGSSGDFVALCRKIVIGYYPRAKVKIANISINKNEWADILAEVDTAKWSDLIMFRFIRVQGTVGELVIRDFHSHLKDAKAGKGICISVGTFNEEAKRYTEARLIDLIEKDRLQAILNNVDAKVAAAVKTR
ncbi:MAG: tetratricopeptide repeat protein [Treponema sp.]|nr:tetratricopeptide repeat protein [Treponema sp.]